MRLLLVGAFAYPHHQGSQVYFQEQAIALRAAGAEVELLTYGDRTPYTERDLDRWRALDGFTHHKTAAWTAPRSTRSGPNWKKPLADANLWMTLYDATALKITPDKNYDAVLTHNAEACVIAMASAKRSSPAHPPIIYCAHTLLENELSTYVKYLKNKDFYDSSSNRRKLGQAPRRLTRRTLDAAGARVDRWVARRADGWIALTQSAYSVIRKFSTRPGALIPPALPDPRHQIDDLDPEAAARRHGLLPKQFYLYSGNLDSYQELGLLAEASRDRPGDAPPIVVASHDPDVCSRIAEWGHALEGRFVKSQSEMLSLLAAARGSLVARRVAGGFPIKIVNALAVGTPPITFLDREWGLTDRQDALVARGDQAAPALREAIDVLDREPELAERLGVGARRLYESAHQPRSAAEQTLGLIRKTLSKRSD